MLRRGLSQSLHHLLHVLSAREIAHQDGVAFNHNGQISNPKGRDDYAFRCTRHAAFSVLKNMPAEFSFARRGDGVPSSQIRPLEIDWQDPGPLRALHQGIVDRNLRRRTESCAKLKDIPSTTVNRRSCRVKDIGSTMREFRKQCFGRKYEIAAIPKESFFNVLSSYISIRLFNKLLNRGKITCSRLDIPISGRGLGRLDA